MPSDKSTYGVNSALYDPSSGFQIQDSWAGDVYNLGAKKVRFVIKASNGSVNIAKYQQLCGYYKSRGIQVVAVLNHETLARTPGSSTDDPNAAYDQGDNTNPYIRNFRALAATLAQTQNLGNAVDVFEIWNEPNNTGDPTGLDPIDAEKYGSLLYNAYNWVKAYNSNIQVITGGLLYHNLLPGGWDGTYVTNLYNSTGVQYWQSTHGAGQWPWDQLSIHLYHSTDQLCSGCLVDQAIQNTRSYQLNRYGTYDPSSPNYGQYDPRGIWVTEFGVPVRDPNDSTLLNTQATNLGQWFDKLDAYSYILAKFWFKHERYAREVQPGVYDYYLLTDFNADGTITTAQHKPSWNTYRSRTGGP